MNNNKSFFSGLIGGVVLTLVLLFVLKAMGVLGERSHVEQPAVKSDKIMKRNLTAGEVPTLGSKDAPIKMTEYADFHCGYCKKAHKTTKKILENYKGKIHYTFRHYPLSNQPGQGSFLTHEASACAGAQGKFWEFHALVFESSFNPTREDLSQYARKINLNVQKFESCLEAGTYQKMIQDDRHQGSRLGVNGTPAFYLNEYRIAGAYPYEHFEKIIEGILDPSKKVVEEPKPSAPKPALKRVEFNDLEGKPFKGSLDAPVTIVEFSDFHCPYCARVNPTLATVMEEYGEKVRIVWRHYPLPFHQGAEVTHQASECAREQKEAKFWEFHDHLFDNVGRYRGVEAFKPAAEATGLDVERFMDCLKSEKYKQVVEEDFEAGKAVGVTGTPAFFVNGEKVSGAQPFPIFKAAIERALDPSQPLPTPDVPKAPKPVKKVEFDDLDEKPSIGPLDAPITIVEFSDFHCPYCKRGSDTMKQVAERFPGKVRRVWRHFPLSFHIGAEITHQASECARDQGKFWEYKDEIFNNFASTRNKDQLLGFAQNLGLDEATFKECLDSEKHKDKVIADVKKGQQVGVRGTPGFFVNGKSFAGAYPFEVFEKEIKSLLGSE